jgi:hypothetical protein
MASLIKEYNTTSELQDDIDAKIKDIEQRINEYSKKIGERLREDKELENDDPNVQQIKEAMEGPTDEKDPKHKKKKKVSKRTNSKWYDINGIYIYNGASSTGELEVYFKALETLKKEDENLIMTKKSLDSLVEKGLKEHIGCIVLHNNGSPPEIVLRQTKKVSKKFSYDSIITVPCELEKITINR